MAKLRKFETISLDKEKRSPKETLHTKKGKLTPYKKTTKNNNFVDFEDEEDLF